MRPGGPTKGRERRARSKWKVEKARIFMFLVESHTRPPCRDIHDPGPRPWQVPQRTQPHAEGVLLVVVLETTTTTTQQL